MTFSNCMKDYWSTTNKNMLEFIGEKTSGEQISNSHKLCTGNKLVESERPVKQNLIFPA